MSSQEIEYFDEIIRVEVIVVEMLIELVHDLKIIFLEKLQSWKLHRRQFKFVLHDINQFFNEVVVTFKLSLLHLFYSLILRSVKQVERRCSVGENPH